MIEIREVLRSWLAGAGLRTVAAQAGVDRKTARRYVEAAVAAGLARDGGIGQLSDELVGQVVEAVRPVRPGGHGQGRDSLESCLAEIRAWVKQGLTVVKIGVLLERQGVAVPYRTLHRFCAERCGYGRSAATTVRVLPGVEDADDSGAGDADGRKSQRPAGGCGGALRSVRCRWWSARCRCQSMTSLTAERVAVSSTRFFPAAKAATRDCRARLLTARG
ncbi:MAG TPA: hypothetical protein VGL33_03390 [Streptosporangiaceae bacterium]